MVSKGEATKERILDQGLELASRVGLEGLSIGALAKATGLSKSGLFAHFGSKEELQLAVLELGRVRFVDRVVAPSLREPRGEPRVRALFENWVGWECQRGPGGCPFVAISHEFDDRPGPAREAIVAVQRDWIETLATAIRIAVDEGHFARTVDTHQLAFEIYGQFLAFHLYHRLLHDEDALARARAGLERLLAAVRA